MSNLELVVAEAKKFGLSGTIDSGAVISVGVKLAAFVNKLPGLKGKDKSELVVAAIIKCIDEMGAAGDEATKARLKDTARVALPSAIQAVLDVSNGKFSIKKVKASTLLSWFSCAASSAISVAAKAGVISNEQVKAAENVLEKVEKVEKVAAKLEGGASVNGEAKEIVSAGVLPVAMVKVEEAVAAAAVAPVAAAVAPVAAAAAAEVPVPVAEVPPPAGEVPPPAGN
uniref:Uncharacterized protein n=1 Tax=viral metagenome TaxID=1070528 RepID=A0A6C0BIN5_9ZZZZ